MHAIPGELLTSTELKEDVFINKLWAIPVAMFDVSGNLIQQKYGDLWLVLASWHRSPAPPRLIRPALLLHLRSGKIFEIYDTEEKGWLWRPDPLVTEFQ
jgi:hypothetical protein